MSSEALSKLVVEGMQDKKASSVTLLDLRGVSNAIADFFVICSGTSDTQIEAIAGSVEEKVYQNTSENPWHREGLNNKEWILLDYVNVVVHIFLKDKRTFYALEDLWGDAKMHQIDDL